MVPNGRHPPPLRPRNLRCQRRVHLSLRPSATRHHCAIQVTWECDQFYGGSLDHHAIGGCPECFAALKAARAAYEASDDYADPRDTRPRGRGRHRPRRGPP
jgi:hypothetical protein